MAEWKKSAAGPGPASTKGKGAPNPFRSFEAWKKGWDDGLKEYAGLWKAWKGPGG